MKVNQDDGIKFYLEEGSWLYIRPLEQEAKVRIYSESSHYERVTQLLDFAKELTTILPMLWRDKLYFFPGLPRPKIRILSASLCLKKFLILLQNHVMLQLLKMMVFHPDYIRK